MTSQYVGVKRSTNATGGWREWHVDTRTGELVKIVGGLDGDMLGRVIWDLADPWASCNVY